MPASNTEAGMKNYVPRRPGKTLNDVVTPEIRAERERMLQEVKDEKDRKKAEEAPTTKTEMGQRFSKGGSVSSRADGIAQRGKTRGKMC